MIDGQERDREAAAVARISDALFSLSGDWRFTYLNDRAAEFLGAPPDDLLGEVIWDRFPETRDTPMPEEFHRALEDGERRSFEVYHRPRETWLSVDAYPDGEGLTVLLRDDRDRGDRTADLRRRAAMVRTADDPMFALDAGGYFVDANDALLSLCGREREELLGDHVTELLDEEDVADGERRLRAALARGESVGTFRVSMDSDEGERRSYEANAALLSSRSAFEGTVVVLRDVTGRRAREQRLAVLDRVLRHNLRNDLNKVLCRAQILQDDVDDPELEATAAGIAETAGDLIDLGDGVRRFADALDPDLGTARPHDAAERVETTVEAIRRRHPDAEVHLRLRAEPRMRAHESTLLAIEELVENGVEHGQPPVEVTVDATGDPDDGRVEIAVADRGPGLPTPERRALVEGEESQLDHASGMGLWLVNWAVTKSGGDLSFSDREGGGSVITVELPRVPPVSG